MRSRLFNFPVFNPAKEAATLLGALLLLAATQPSIAATETSSALVIADAYIEGGEQSAVNFGGAESLLCKTASSDKFTRRPVMKADVRGYGTASKVIVDLRVLSANDTVTITAYNSMLNWAEGEVTWDNPPRLLEKLGSMTISPNDVGKLVSFDVTSAALKAMEFDGKLGLSFVASGNTSAFVTFASREHSNEGNAPSLTLVDPVDLQDYIPLDLEPLAPANSVSQHGITWHFDEFYEIGRFANGDFYVVEDAPGEGVTITKIDPTWTTAKGWDQNGSMINPTSGTSARQGFDSSTYNWASELNIEAGLPKAVLAGSSIVSSISESSKGNRPQLTDVAVLTVLAEKPPEGSFRPPYAGADKKIRGTEASLDYKTLKNLRLPLGGANVPHLLTVTEEFARPWIEINTQWTGRDLHPLNNQPDYGREIAYAYARGLLSLNLDYDERHKKKLFIRLVQHGIDIFGAAKAGANWANNGGHNHGRKAVLLLAAKALNDPEMLWYCDAQSFLGFQEDQQTFYVSQREVNTTNGSDWDPDTRAGTPEPYTADHIGMPEWGILHKTQPNKDNAAWQTSYRDTVGASILGSVLAVRIMGLQDVWNHPALFDYTDRYWNLEKHNAANSSNKIRTFPRDMWNAYRDFELPKDPGDLQVQDS